MINRRRKYLINKSMQLKLIGLVAIPMLLCPLGLYFIIYYFVMNEMVIPEAIAGVLLPALRKVNVLLFILTPILVYAVLRIALVYSNKIAGPLYRLEKELDRVADGDFNVRIKFRAGDELHPIAGKVNSLLEKIETMASKK